MGEEFSSLFELLQGQQHPADRVALIDESSQLTYGEFFPAVIRRAHQLQAMGVQPGDVVALQLPNGIEFAVTCHAILAAGATMTPMSPDAPARDVAHQLTLTNTRLHITPATEYPAPADVPLPQVSPDDVACLPLSSGTTGTPKAVVLQHRQLVANVQQFGAVVQVAPGETVLSMLPLTHIYGLQSTLNTPLYLGATIVTGTFSPERFFAAFGTYGINTAFIAPPMATLLAHHPAAANADYSALHTMVSGAAPLKASIGQRAEEVTGARIRQGYGMTETAPVTHLSVRDSSPLESIGDPLPETQQRLVDPETGEDVAPGEPGELWVSGPQLMAGYLNNVDGTEAAFVGKWLRTGDIAQQLEDGSLRIVDRFKDVFKVRGFQVSPVKVEQVLLELPCIIDCAVVRGFDASGHSVVAVAAVPKPSIDSLKRLTTARLRRVLEAELAEYELPRFVHIVSEIPRTSSGKIRRSQIAASLGY